SIKSFELPDRARVEKAARQLYELLTARNRNIKGETALQQQARIRRAENEYVDVAVALRKMLLDPIASELAQKRLVVVADGALQYVPFAALPVPAQDAVKDVKRPSDARFVPLIAEHEIVSLPSASVLASIRDELQRRRPAPELVAVLADPVFNSRDDRLMSGKRKRLDGVENHMLATARVRGALRSFKGWAKPDEIPRLPFSMREANAIKAAAPAEGVMFALGFRASRATVSSPKLANYRIIHFATHGIIDSEHPEFSGILLSRFDEAGTYQEGFFLQLREIYNLNLPAELIVLSACQTALGKDIRGEGLVGLTRGFMYAGAARVVASLWQVDDAATAELMGEFYRAMFGGEAPAKALQTAQVRMWQNRRWSNPYHWAAFTLQGEWK
ncbi:MAG TPA: CHAT domain-containing protein, partial [Pyrinomonadaceae bacterium]|nr:CHAT domain-containing protein [Pyrinomonadaceae bacterium]